METKFGKFITSRGFAAWFLILMAAAVGYAGLRAGNAAEWLWGRRVYLPILALLVLLLVLTAISQHAGDGTRAMRNCRRISGCFLSFLLYDVLALLLADAAAFLLRLDTTARARLILAAAGLSLLLLICGGVHARRLKTVSYRVDLGMGERGVRAVLLSDLHIGVFIGPRYLERVVKEVNCLEPELVVIAGDLFDGCLPASDRTLHQLAAVFRTLRAPEGVYAVTGNPDPGVEEPRFRQFFEEAHIRLLYNETVELSHVFLIGRAGIVSMKEVRTPLRGLMPEGVSRKPTIVLDHDPQGIREAASCGVDLVLCGHTHKGQFFPMDLLTRWANGSDCFYGYGRRGKTHSVISAGTGFFQIPIRIGTNSEIVTVDMTGTGPMPPAERGAAPGGLSDSE